MFYMYRDIQIINIKFHQIRMRPRPKSSNPSTKKNLTNITHVRSDNKNRYYDHSSSSLVDSRYAAHKKWEFKSEKIAFSDPKSIQLISVYQPKKLNKCLLSNPKDLKQHFNRDGPCSLAQLSGNSFVQYLKEWRKDVRAKIANMMAMIVDTDPLKQETFEKIKQIFKQQKQILKQMKETATNVGESTQQLKLKESFRNISSYLKRLQPIIDLLHNYLKDVGKLMDMVAQSSLSLSQIKKKLKSIHKDCQRQLVEFINFCYCHPEASQISKLQYQIKLKFDKIYRSSVQSLDHILSQRQLKQKLAKQIAEIMNKQMENDEQALEALENLIGIFYEIDISKGRIDKDEEDMTIADQLIRKIILEIQEIQSKFLVGFKHRAQQMIIDDLRSRQANLLLDCLQENNNSWKNSKKKLLLLSKIYSKDRDPDLYENLSNCIKNSSQNYRDIQQCIQMLKSISKDKKYQSRHEIYSILKMVIRHIQQYEEFKYHICVEIGLLLNKVGSSNLEEERISRAESEKVQRLLYLLDFSDHQTAGLLTFDQIIKDPSKINEGQLEKEIRETIKKNKKSMDKFQREGMREVLDYSYQLNKLENDKLISELLLFEEDLKNQAIHSFHLIKQFYVVLETHENKRIKYSRKGEEMKIQEIKRLIEEFMDAMKESVTYKNSLDLRKYLQQMFETYMSSLVMQKQKLIEKIMSLPENNTYPFSEKCQNSKYGYHWSPRVRGYMKAQYGLLKNIVSECQKYIKGDSIFDIYLQKILNKMEIFLRKWEYFYKFWMSQWDNSLYIGAKSLETWINWEYLNFLQQHRRLKIMKKHQKTASFDFNDHLKVYRHKISTQLQTQIQKLNDLLIKDQEMDFGRQFIYEINKKIKHINEYLLPMVSSQLVEYPKVVSSCLKYLRKSNMKHIGICAKNEQAINFLTQGEIKYVKNVVMHYENLLGLPRDTIQADGQSLKYFQIVEPPEAIDKSMFTVKYNKTNQNQPHNPRKISQESNAQMGEEILQDEQSEIVEDGLLKEEFEEYDQDPEIAESLVLQEQIEPNKQQQNVPFILDQVEENQFVSEEPMFILPDTNKKEPIAVTEEPMFILPDNKAENIRKKGPSFILQSNSSYNNTSKMSLSEGELHLIDSAIYQNSQSPLLNLYLRSPQSNNYAYYKMTKFDTLQQMAQKIICSELEIVMIAQALDAETLIKVLSKNPTDQKEVIDHLNNILEQSSHNSLMTLVNAKRQYSKTEKTILEFKNCIEDNSAKSQQVEDKLLNVLKIMDITCRPIYQGKNEDRIILFDEEEGPDYCFVNLHDPHPFDQSDFDKELTQGIMEYQGLLLASLLSSSKNKHIDQIQNHAGMINEKLAQAYKKLRLKLYKFREHHPKMENRIDEEVTQYYDSVTHREFKLKEEQSLNKNSVGEHIKKVKEVQQLIEIVLDKANMNKLITLKLKDSPNFGEQPIVFMRSPEQLQSLLESPLLQLPGPLVEPHQYLCRQTKNQFMLNIKGYKNDIIKSINKKIKIIKPEQLLDLVLRESNVTQNYKQLDKNIGQLQSRNQNIDEITNNQAYARFKELEPILMPGDNPTLQSVIGNLGAEKIATEKVLEIRNSKTSFILEDNQQQDMTGFQDLNQGIFILDDKPQFFTQNQPESLSELSQCLREASMKHIVVQDKYDKVIGILPMSNNKRETINRQLAKSLNICSEPFLETKFINPQTVQIPQLLIALIPSKLQLDDKVEQNKQEILEEMFENESVGVLYIEVFNNETRPIKIRINSKTMNKEINVECPYPRKQMAVRLIREKTGETEQIWKKQLKCYKYGQKFLLIAVDGYIKEQYERVKNQKIYKQSQIAHKDNDVELPEIAWKQFNKYHSERDFESQRQESIILSDHVCYDKGYYRDRLLEFHEMPNKFQDIQEAIDNQKNQDGSNAQK